MKKIILSGGGTGGHIYPAVAVAEALKARLGDAIEIMFVGAEGRMEMEKIPALGYKIVGLPITGLQRRLDWRNIQVPYKLLKSIGRANRIIREFGADIVVGFGGYASAPILWAAQQQGVPTIIQEQNSHAGVTNKILARRAEKICVAYEGMERFFAKEKIVMTGNPLRGNFATPSAELREEAFNYFGLDSSRPTILVVGGSLGTRTLNEMMKHWLSENEGCELPVQVIWQSGKFYHKEMESFLERHPSTKIWQGAFIERMDLAYAAADIIISRSGACTVSELCLLGKATIFVPSPNVAEDHQTMNAMALVNRGAAHIIKDSEAVQGGMSYAKELIGNRGELKNLENNILKLATPTAAESIVDEILKVIK